MIETIMKRQALYLNVPIIRWKKTVNPEKGTGVSQEILDDIIEKESNMWHQGSNKSLFNL